VSRVLPHMTDRPTALAAPVRRMLRRLTTAGLPVMMVAFVGVAGCADPYAAERTVPPPAYYDARDLYQPDLSGEGVASQDTTHDESIDSGDYPLPPVTDELPLDPGAAYYPPSSIHDFDAGPAYLGSSSPALQQEFYLGRSRYLYDPFYDGLFSPYPYRSRYDSVHRYPDFGGSGFRRPYYGSYYGWRYDRFPGYAYRRSVGDDSHTPRRDDRGRPRDDDRNDDRQNDDRTPREPQDRDSARSRPGFDRVPVARREDAQEERRREDDRPVRDARQALERQREARRQEPQRQEPRRDEPRREEPRREAPRRDDRPVRDARQAFDRDRNESPSRNDRPRDDRPREDRPREDRPRR
jgi:hypothetical protein